MDRDPNDGKHGQPNPFTQRSDFSQSHVDIAFAECLVVPASGVAALLQISERHVHALHGSGRLPHAIRLGRSVRWNVAELTAWRDAGCPARDEWEHVRRGGRP